jgi:glycosyltransferase involved in cell wall biosynthesis
MQRGKRLRVGFDARWYNDSGVGSYVTGLLGALAREDEINLVVYEHSANPVPPQDGCNLRRVEVKATKYSLAEQRELARLCAEHCLDVFHSPFYIVPWLAPCPVVVTLHDLIPFRFPIYSWPKRRMVQTGYRLAVRKAEHVIADSKRTADDIQQVLGVDVERISVVPIAAARNYSSDHLPGDAALLAEQYGVRRPYVLVASARNWRVKNLEIALRVVEVARQQNRVDFQTVVFGPREGFRAAGGEDRWRHLNLKSTGYIAEEELAVLYRHASAFLMPSLYEGFGLPVLEAMACGCPVVCSNGGALAEVAGRGAQVFDPMDVRGMAAALSELVRSEENLRSWKAAALRRSADFCWQKAARETISVYHRTHKALPLNRVASNS